MLGEGEGGQSLGPPRVTRAPPTGLLDPSLACALSPACTNTASGPQDPRIMGGWGRLAGTQHGRL